MLHAKGDTIDMDLTKGAATNSQSRTAGRFLTLVVEHILTGYDHLLFLLALLIAGGTLRTAAKLITSFTIAHSITLALATLDLVRIPSSWVEPLIALSIVYVGLENIVRRDLKRRWFLTLAFGLIHGFGFATALRQLGIGTTSGQVVVPLLTFNLGVELGQIMMAALALPLIAYWKKCPTFVTRFVPACSVLVALAGLYWFIQRTLLG